MSFLSESPKLDETDQELLKQLKTKEMSNEAIVQYISKVLFVLETARKWADALQSEIAKLDFQSSFSLSKRVLLSFFFCSSSFTYLMVVLTLECPRRLLVYTRSWLFS